MHSFHWFGNHICYGSNKGIMQGSRQERITNCANLSNYRYYSQVTTSKITQGGATKDFLINKGLHQGSTLSQLIRHIQMSVPCACFL